MEDRFWSSCDWLDIVNVGSAATTALAALVALAFGILQTISVLKGQREATAISIWSEFQIKCIVMAEFASPDISDLDIDNETLNGSKIKYEQYTWFVSYMLLAIEEILRLRPTADWIKTVEDALDMHREYLESDKFKAFLGQLSPALTVQYERFVKRKAVDVAN